MYSFYKVLTSEELAEIPHKQFSIGPNPAEFRKTAFSGQTANSDDKVSLEREAFRYAQEL